MELSPALTPQKEHVCQKSKAKHSNHLTSLNPTLRTYIIQKNPKSKASPDPLKQISQNIATSKV